MTIQINPWAVVVAGVLLTGPAWGQEAGSKPNPADSSSPSESSSPVRKPRLNRNQDIDSQNGAVTPSTPGTSRTPGTPGATGTPGHPSGG